MSNDFKEIRCKKCNRLLMQGEIAEIKIKCPKCGYLQLISELHNLETGKVKVFHEKIK